MRPTSQRRKVVRRPHATDGDHNIDQSGTDGNKNNNDSSSNKNDNRKVVGAIFAIICFAILMFTVFGDEDPKERPPSVHFADKDGNIIKPHPFRSNNNQNNNNNENINNGNPNAIPNGNDFDPTKKLIKKDKPIGIPNIREPEPQPLIDDNDDNDDNDRIIEKKDTTTTTTTTTTAKPTSKPTEKPSDKPIVKEQSENAVEGYKWPPLLENSKFVTLNVENNVDANEFYSNMWENVKLQELRSLDDTNQIYLFNTIFLPKSNMITVFLLTEEYLNPDHGLHAWTTRRRKDVPNEYKNIRKTVYKNYKTVNPSFACVFKDTNGNENDAKFIISKVDYVPNNTTRDRYVNDGTEILRCKIPISQMNEKMFSDANSNFEFLLTQKWQQFLKFNEMDTESRRNLLQDNENLVHTKIFFNVGTRSGVPLSTNVEPLLVSDTLRNNENKNRYLTLCMPPMSEPLPFIAENVAHHLAMGVEHIYIGTHFEWNDRERYTQELIERVQPWYDKGLITIWPHEQPWLGFTDKAKHHWLNQCLYYVKDRDTFTLSLDADEFVLVNKYDNDIRNGENVDIIESPPLVNLLESQTGKDKNEWCWLSFQSYQMWKLWYPNEKYMIRRFTGREDKPQMTWSKVIWNNKFLWYTGYHAGGACNAQNHDWRQIVYDWREQRDAKHVHRFDPNSEGRIWHYYNSRHIRIEPSDSKHRNPWSALVNDTSMHDIYWTNVKAAFEKYSLPSTYPADNYDVMKTEYYLKHYGDGHAQTDWHS